MMAHHNQREVLRMKPFRVSLAASVLVASMGMSAPALSTQDSPQPGQGAQNLSGLHDFDFLVGSWRVHHRRLKERLANSHDWQEFEGTCTMWLTMNRK